LDALASRKSGQALGTLKTLEKRSLTNSEFAGEVIVLEPNYYFSDEFFNYP
jgi:hypothetical protein